MLSKDQAAEMFLEELVLKVYEGTVKAVFDALEKEGRYAPNPPPGPLSHLLHDLHQWFANLSEEDQHRVR